jgi:predicted PurR-regulated permease PerM
VDFPKSAKDVVPLRLGLGVGLGFLIIAVVALASWHIRTVLVIIFLAGFLATGLNQVVKFLTSKGLKRPWAITAIVVAGALVTCGLLGAVVPTLVKQAAAFMNAIPSIVDELKSIPFFDGTELPNLLTPQNVSTVVTGVLGGAASAAIFAGASVTVVLLSLFILGAYEPLQTGAYRLFPSSKRDRFRSAGDDILGKVGGYLVGAVCIALIAGTTSFVFMKIAGIPYALLLAIVVMVLDLIPQVGATIAAVVVIAVALSESFTLAVVAAIFFIVYQQTENWVIYPRVMKHALKISNLAALVVVMIGAALFGVLGAIIALPAYASIQLLIREFYLKPREAR